MSDSWWLFVTVAHQGLLFMGLSRQEYWSGLPCLLQGTFLTQGLNPHLLTSPALAGRLFITSATWETLSYLGFLLNINHCHGPKDWSPSKFIIQLSPKMHVHLWRIPVPPFCFHILGWPKNSFGFFQTSYGKPGIFFFPPIQDKYFPFPFRKYSVLLFWMVTIFWDLALGKLPR